MTRKEIINQLKEQLILAEKEFRGTAMHHALKDALTLLESQGDLEKKLNACEMNKQILKNEIKELKEK